MTMPAPAAAVQGRYLLTTYMTVYDATDLKEYASVVGGIAVGFAMAATGPLVLVPILPTSYTHVELVLFDTQTGEIVWSSGFYDDNDGLRNQRSTLRYAMLKFPAHPGRKAVLPEAMRRTKL